MTRARARLALAALAVVARARGRDRLRRLSQHAEGRRCTTAAPGTTRFVGHYSVKVLETALATLSGSDAEYTNCADALRSALRALIDKHHGQPGPRASPAAARTRRRPARARTAPPPPNLIQPARCTPREHSGKRPDERQRRDGHAGASVANAVVPHDIPTPLLIVLAALLATLLAVGAPTLLHVCPHTPLPLAAAAGPALAATAARVASQLVARDRDRRGDRRDLLRRDRRHRRAGPRGSRPRRRTRSLQMALTLGGGVLSRSPPRSQCVDRARARAGASAARDRCCSRSPPSPRCRSTGRWTRRTRGSRRTARSPTRRPSPARSRSCDSPRRAGAACSPACCWRRVAVSLYAARGEDHPGVARRAATPIARLAACRSTTGTPSA